MKITLSQGELEVAVRNYVRETGITLRDQSVNVNFINGRAPNGTTAEIEITSEGQSSTTAKPSAKQSSAAAPVEEITETEPEAPAESEDATEDETPAETAEETPVSETPKKTVFG